MTRDVAYKNISMFQENGRDCKNHRIYMGIYLLLIYELSSLTNETIYPVVLTTIYITTQNYAQLKRCLQKIRTFLYFSDESYMNLSINLYQ